MTYERAMIGVLLAMDILLFLLIWRSMRQNPEQRKTKSFAG